MCVVERIKTRVNTSVQCLVTFSASSRLLTALHVLAEKTHRLSQCCCVGIFIARSHHEGNVARTTVPGCIVINTRFSESCTAARKVLGPHLPEATV